ncbi:MAG: hypothetical protein B7Z36_03405 [Novosphingobium sp. 12-63-9]|nr:MAG: hypothetical protein B7Z36_03405 [Novosphingobium sp. 12-63-9]
MTGQFRFNDFEGLRRAPRVGFELPVRCKDGITRSTVMLKDMTQFGAQVQGITRQRVGEPLTLLLPGLPATTAYVVWANAMTAGLEFDRPLHPEAFAELVSDYAIGHARKPAGLPVRHAA